MRGGHLYLGSKNRKGAVHLLASASQKEEEHRSQDGHDGRTTLLWLGSEGAEAEVAELAEENRAFDWSGKRESQAGAGT